MQYLHINRDGTTLSWWTNCAGCGDAIGNPLNDEPDVEGLVEGLQQLDKAAPLFGVGDSDLSSFDVEIPLRGAHIVGECCRSG